MNTKTLIAAAAALILTSWPAPTFAISYEKNWVGKWCQVRTEDTWVYFQRGNKCADTTLMLQRNGDYVLTGHTPDIERCRATRSYTHGWTDYVCSVDGAYPQKRFEKFRMDTVTGELMRNSE